MKTSIFLSYPKPFTKRQEQFVNLLSKYLNEHGFEPRTLGVTDYDMDAPLKAIRRLMLESNGLLAIAFRRSYVKTGTSKPKSDINEKEIDLSNTWLTSPYCHIEPAMAFQLGLPVLILRENGVLSDGILEKGVLGTYMPEFSLEKSFDEYFQSNEFLHLIGKWEGYVRRVVEKKGNPQQLF
ncbi:hypothetical protein [Rummeliibacillus suwonensis]|uniref:hypothetical protein n=1 Tax=Rummeliibacillus suwonensis TaxID=1306154 RepID=UPI0011B858B3|nr:hypothetical protein [Rummeliibacillus suwonensis]